MKSDRRKQPVPVDRAPHEPSTTYGPVQCSPPRDVSLSALREWADNLDPQSTHAVISASSPSPSAKSVSAAKAVPIDNLVLLALLACYCRQFAEAKFDRCRALLDVSEEQLYSAGRYLVATASPLSVTGRFLISQAARLNFADAVVYELQVCLKRPGNRKASEAVLKTRLRGLCQDKSATHVRALTTAAQLARLDGDIRACIRYAERALGPALTAFEAEDHAELSRLQATDRHDISSKPWLELAMAYELNGRVDEALAALQKGIDADDPLAYYAYAMLHRTAIPEGLYSARWVHDMTKAAASGHVLAMVELATYYAGGAKIEDSGARHDSDMALLHEKAGDYGRLAISWLDIAIEYGYLKASGLKARLLAGHSILSMSVGNRGEDGDETDTSELYDRQAALACLQLMLTKAEGRAMSRPAQGQRPYSPAIDMLNMHDLEHDPDSWVGARNLAKELESHV